MKKEQTIQKPKSSFGIFLKLFSVFFISLASFTLGTFVGKALSDTQAKISMEQSSWKTFPIYADTKPQPTPRNHSEEVKKTDNEASTLLKVQTPKDQTLKAQAPKDQTLKAQAPKDQMLKAQAPKAQTPNPVAAKNLSKNETTNKTTKVQKTKKTALAQAKPSPQTNAIVPSQVTPQAPPSKEPSPKRNVASKSKTIKNPAINNAPDTTPSANDSWSDGLTDADTDTDTNHIPPSEPLTDEEIAELTQEFSEIEKNSLFGGEDSNTDSDSSQESLHENQISHEKNKTASLSSKLPTKKTKKPFRHLSSLPSDILSEAIGKFTVQVASRTEQEEAQNLTDKLKKQGYSAFYTPIRVNRQDWYRISVGIFENRKTAYSFRKKLEKNTDFDDALIKKIIY